MGSGIGSYFGTLTMLIITIMSVERWLHMSRRSLVTVRRTCIAIAVLLLLPIPFAVCRVLSNPSNIAVNVASCISFIVCISLLYIVYSLYPSRLLQSFPHNSRTSATNPLKRIVPKCCSTSNAHGQVQEICLHHSLHPSDIPYLLLAHGH